MQQIQASPYFQYTLLVMQLMLIYFHKQINHKFDKLEMNAPLIKYTLFSIPLLIIVFYDVQFSSFSLKNLGLPIKYNNQLNYVLQILGSYGIIQILAQDSGLKTGELQRDTVQHHWLFSIMALGMAYSVTSNRSQSMIAVLMYYHLKYVISNNKTSPVCFEDV